MSDTQLGEDGICNEHGPSGPVSSRKYYLNTFKPLCLTGTGRQAVQQYDLPPYIDSSIRREPDFEHAVFPSISALCRLTKFAPRLHPGDMVVYLTCKAPYGKQASHWRLVATLQVQHRFETHKEAAAWYEGQNLALPSNCWVTGNYPVPYEKSCQIKPYDLWDREYRARARKCGVFLTCTAVYVNYQAPPALVDEDILSIFGRIPGTQNPPEITEQQYQAIMAHAA